MTTINPTSGNAPSVSERLRDMHVDAVYLHAMAQGIDALFDTIETERSPASNSMPAMFQSLIERADRLANALEGVKL